MNKCLNCIHFHESKDYALHGYCKEPYVVKYLGEFTLLPDDFGCPRIEQKAPGLPGANETTRSTS
jgi:hypothetical protein